MRYLKSLNKYLWKYRWRFLLGILFIVLSNYFRILAPQVTGYVVNLAEKQNSIDNNKIQTAADSKKLRQTEKNDSANYDILVKKFIRRINEAKPTFGKKILVCGITLLILALISGFFTFLMRQTIIVMSR
ncbi:MAG TPA: hypothetical protein VK787_14840, partial [Puia sp.]|nr:hypothetical protein [Puia sp.]